MFFDGRRLLGRAKTVRGALVSIALTAAAAPLLGLGAAIGVLVGGTAMVGDLLSSFVKRRLNFAPSSQAIGLDQIPESLFPVLACLRFLPLRGLDIVIVVAVFCIGSISLSPVFHRMGLRDRPF
ncbi:MAG TPA: CDP-archaeol synthase [Stellaceae bacterium]|nr:CDP-archaeol synthase [Stellaceae bacterium]HEV2551898.1 CDP-archaeol synthase [Stellaceae bacterium]